MTCTTKFNFKQTVRKQAYTRYSIENQLVYLEKKAKYGLEPELLTQLAIRQLSNIRTLGHYTTVFARDPTRVQQAPSNRRQEEVGCNNNSPGLQMQLSIFYIKMGIGNQLAVPGEAQCRKVVTTGTSQV